MKNFIEKYWSGILVILMWLSIIFVLCSCVDTTHDPTPLGIGIEPSPVYSPANPSGKPGKPPVVETFIESIVGTYEVYMDTSVYTIEVVQKDNVTVIFKNFNKEIDLPADVVSGNRFTTTWSRDCVPLYDGTNNCPGVIVYSANSFQDVDFSLTIQARIQGVYVTVKMYPKV